MIPMKSKSPTMTQFEGSQLRLARHYWGKTLNDIAEEVGKTRQYISQIENGKAGKNISDDTIELLAQCLKVAPGFFYKHTPPGPSEDQAHFRRLSSTKVSTRLKVLARGTIFRQLANYIDKHVALPNVDFPDHAGSVTFEEIERAAERTRSYWGLGLGPIDNMVRVVEHAGALVTFFRDASTEVDALSIPSSRPIIVRNDAKESPFRQRFDIAHEMAHLILHEGIVTGDRTTETEANRFASAFLLPRSTFSKVFRSRGRRLDWQCIIDIKMQFGTSKAAILYRAKALGLISDNTYKSGVIYLKNSGQSKQEDEDLLVEREKAELLIKSFKVMHDHFGLSFYDLADEIGVHPELLGNVMPDIPDSELSQAWYTKFRRPSLSVVQ